MTTTNTQPERLDNLQRLELESTIGFEGWHLLANFSRIRLIFYSKKFRKSSSWLEITSRSYSYDLSIRM